MLPYAFLTFVILGTSYAAYLDLKTSEVPDWISLLVAGGSVFYYLSTSITLPFGAVDALLVMGTIMFAAAVGTYLKLYRSIPDRFAGERAAALLDGKLFTLDRADVAGTALLVFSGGTYLAGVMQGGVQPVVLSVGIGTAMFALGWSMYILGMWGGADAFMLGVVGYALPVLPETVSPMYALVLPVPVALVTTVFIVGALYSIGYAIVVAVRDEQATELFVRELSRSRRTTVVLSAAAFALFLAMGYGLSRSLNVPLQLVVRNAAVFTAVFVMLLVLYRFLKVVEQHVMRTTIPVNELQPGDVLADDLDRLDEPVDAERIVGVTADQIERIQGAYETVAVRTGVRFIVAFPIAILLLVTVGDPAKAILFLL